MACVYPKCIVTSHSERIILPTCSLQSAFSDLLNTTQQVRLCVTHYQCLCRQISVCADRSMSVPIDQCLCQQINVCADRSIDSAGCGAMPKYRQGCYTRHSPDAVTVSTYLNDCSEFGVTLSPSDTLCKSCYDMHMAIVQHLEKNDSTCDLESDLMLWNSTVYDEHTTELTKQYCSQ